MSRVCDITVAIPSNPHSFLRMSVRSFLLAQAGTLLMLGVAK